MHSDCASTMATSSSTTNSTRDSSAREAVSITSVNTMQSQIAVSPLPSASTLSRGTIRIFNFDDCINQNNSPATTLVTIHESGETVPVITRHQHDHHQLHQTNGLNITNDHIRPNDILVDSSSTSSTVHQQNLIDNSIITTTSTAHNVKVIHMDSSTSTVTSQCSIPVSDDCIQSTSLSHQSILMHTNPDSVIPTSPIATLSLESSNSACPSISIANNNNNNNNNCNKRGSNIIFGGDVGSEDELVIDTDINQSTTIASATCDNFSGNVPNSNLQKSSCATTSTSTSSPTTSKLQVSNESSSMDNLNLSMSADSLSSESVDIDIKDLPIDDHEGYQDNTSSNSQQSAGGGSVSGGGGGGGVISGNGNSGYISLIPPPVGTTGGTITQCSEQIDFKHLFEELCPVCGDKVSGYHYGLLTCESCKGFFKRTVQNKKVYTCVAERSCHIDKTQRKRCPYCRFQKCLEVGMKLEAVRADRMRGGRNKFGPMYKRDRARKLQMMRQRQLALQAIRGSMGSTDIKPGQLSPTGYQQSYPSMNIKQEIQIPQVSSLTQSPDSSPSPIAIALGQVNPSTAIIATSLSGSSGSGSNTTTVSGAGGGGGGSGCSHSSDTGSGTSLQHTSDSKLCFDTGTNPSSTADSVSNVEPLRVSPMIREFVQSIDDREWQTQLFTLLQKQSYNQVEVDLFELMCKVLDQNLFSQVDWARNTIFFKDLKVDDQMKLLQHSWSDMLVLDHLHQRIHNGLPDDAPLHNGQRFNLLELGLLGVPQLADYFNELQNKLQELKFDMGDYVCMKFLILLNPNVRGIINKKTVLEGHENVQAALLDYTLTCYPSVTDKFSRLLSILPEIHAMAARGEEHLYLKHCAGSAPTQTLLMEMLHAKRKV